MDSTDTILIIDDDRSLRLALRAFLEGPGVAIIEASDGPEGLLSIMQDPPAIVLLDITLPGMSGFEVLERIRALPEGKHVAVIIMTSLLDPSQRLKAFRCGAVDYVTKPLHYEEVGARLRTHLEIRRQSIVLRESHDQLHIALQEADAINRNLIDLNEKLLHSEKVKTRFLALMRNEINNPLNDIMGLADRILDTAVPMERARELAAMVKDEAFQLDCQIRNVFCAAELEAGEASPYIARVDVRSVVGDVMESFASSAKAKGLEMTFHIEVGNAPFPTDVDKLHQILANLLANAVRFSSPSGKVEIWVTEGEDRLMVKVVDEGPGISEEELRTTFEPSHQSGTNDIAQRSQGLGLPVVKALVDILDGELKVESKPGLGSEFQVSLPRASSLNDIEADAVDGNILIFDEPQEF
jgi:signal transduction histidine kinase